MKFIPRFQYFPLLAFGLLAYLVALMLSFPAERAYSHWQASENASSDIALSGISGSVWSGKAAMAMIQGQPLEKVEWSLRPWSLLLGQVGLSWRFQLPPGNEKEGQGQGGYGQGSTALGLDGSVAFSTLEARLPAGMIARIARVDALRPTGSVSLNLHDVLWDGQSLRSAEGRIVWNSAGISLLKPISLGDQAITLETGDDVVKGVLSDGGGPLSLDGLLTLNLEGQYEFSGSLAARNAPDLDSALRSLGRPGTDGRITLKRSGSLVSLGLAEGG
ncbi:MAG: type II secretion system protein N [Gammaproteobacteria bacterium]|nr:type II secretion system protein N [Gammaproteobacteria bacterium]